ncbi:MAG: hypothetical protein JNG88_13495 [Phycisphaerales bacterium]|nr:hypothetical protein [Phycisphaerales bacterium]
MNSPFSLAPLVITLSAILAALAGCWRPPTPTPQQLDHGLIVLFPGIEGGPWQVEGPTRAFRAAGVKSAIIAHDWKRFARTLANLIDYENNRKAAGRRAAEITKYALDHPGRPIDLVGYSGGGGLAIFVVEALPDDPRVRVRNVVLAQAAISPGYDLRPALRHMDGVIVNLYSRLDKAVLGLGTELFGTMDRVHSRSVGEIGFDIDRAAPDDALRARVIQRGWSPDDETLGHNGGHLDIVARAWNRVVIAPYLTDSQSGLGAAGAR